MMSLLAVALSNAAASPPAGKYVTAELIAESADPEPGTTILVGFRFEPKPGWHGYWSNPGEAGIAPSVRWTAPRGVTFGSLLHPAPTLLSYGGVDSYVHSGEHVLLARMTVEREIATGTPLDITANLSWASCTETMCVPERAKLTLRLVAGNGGASFDAPLLQASKSRLPRAAGEGRYRIEDRTLVLSLPASVRLRPRAARFFPDQSGFYDAGRAQSDVQSGRLVITGPTSGTVPLKFTGVVTDGRDAYRLAFTPSSPSVAGSGAAPQSRMDIHSGVTEPPSRAMPIEPGAVPAKNSPQSRSLSWAWTLIAILAAAAALIAFSRRR